MPGDFDVLDLDSDGVGNYHFNRYRAVFTSKRGTREELGETSFQLVKDNLAADFVRNFPAYLNSPAGEVERTKRRFHGAPTLRFTAHLPHAPAWVDQHRDWVVVIEEKPRQGFAVQTLKRNFNEPTDVMAPLVSPLLGGAASYLNHYHLLAGRRSWRLDSGDVFNLPKDLLVLETAAVERYSQKAFEILGLTRLIPDVWINNVANFVNRQNVSALANPPLKSFGGQWRARGYVRYMVNEGLVGAGGLRSSPEFLDALRIHPRLLGPAFPGA